MLARDFGIGGQQQGGHQQSQGGHQGPPPGGFQGGGGGGGNFGGGPQGGGGNNYGGPGPNNFGGMQGGGRDEQQKKVDQKEKGEKNVDCCHDKEDCPRQGRDSKSVDLVREGFKKSKWKFKMAFAMKGGGSRGGLECHIPILKNDFC